MIDNLLAVTLLVLIAAITPGPNNIVVMSLAARTGIYSTLPAITGIITGGLILVMLVALGAQSIFESVIWLQPMLLLIGVCYLIYKGLSMMWCNVENTIEKRNSTEETHTGGMLQMLSFQFLNPKSWVLVTASVSTASAGGHSELSNTLPTLLILFIFIPLICLSLWALMGNSIRLLLEDSTNLIRFNRIMGALLVVSALFLIN